MKPSYPNWQRKRTQNPSSVGSNPTEGTTDTHGCRQLPGGFACPIDGVRRFPARASILGKPVGGPGRFPDSP